MAFCTTCGTETETGKYCTNCGALAGSQSAAPLNQTQPGASTYGSSTPSQDWNTLAVSKTNTFAIVSLVTSLLGLFTAGLTCIAGVVFGHVALVQIKLNNESGRGMALAGLIVGYIGVALISLVLISLAVFLNSSAQTSWT